MIQEKHDTYRDDDQQRDARDRAIAYECERQSRVAERFVAAKQMRQRAEHGEARQRDQNGRQAGRGDDPSVKTAEQNTGRETSDDTEHPEIRHERDDQCRRGGER